LFQPSRNGSGALMPLSRGDTVPPGTPPPHGDAGRVIDDHAGELATPEADPAGAAERLVSAHAREIAVRLAVPRPRSDRSRKRGIGELRSLPYRGGSDEIDLDRTLQVLCERPFPDDEDIVVRERVNTRRDVVLLVDVSGSMKGERIRTAAATVGALAGELTRDRLSVIAFWSDAAILLRLGDAIVPHRLLTQVLGLPAQGLTNVAFPLELAAQELLDNPSRDARVVLLSDCVHNAGPDPRIPAARLPRLDVLLDATGEQDEELGRELSRMGRGRFRRVASHRDVAPALTELFRR
jgi:Mg-chelatase subunit ChlD